MVVTRAKKLPNILYMTTSITSQLLLLDKTRLSFSGIPITKASTNRKNGYAQVHCMPKSLSRRIDREKDAKGGRCVKGDFWLL